MWGGILFYFICLVFVFVLLLDYFLHQALKRCSQNVFPILRTKIFSSDTPTCSGEIGTFRPRVCLDSWLSSLTSLPATMLEHETVDFQTAELLKEQESVSAFFLLFFFFFFTGTILFLGALLRGIKQLLLERFSYSRRSLTGWFNKLDPIDGAHFSRPCLSGRVCQVSGCGSLPMLPDAGVGEA